MGQFNSTSLSASTTDSPDRLPANPEASHAVHSLLATANNNRTQEILLKPVFEAGSDAWLNGRKAFTATNILSAQECISLITTLEEIGFEKALISVGPGKDILDETYRKSQRRIVDSVPLSEAIWERIKHLVPETVPSPAGLPMRVVGLNERLRVLKYMPGDSFKPHRDSTFSRGNEMSVFTVQLYLNDCEEGGATAMWGDGKSSDIKREARCEAGNVAIFSHRIMHEGSEVMKGVKYTIRTEVMYSFQ
ncbi:hypothetical protein CcCBS67573_g01671 [Chytriomyces confervae]|uniref:Prolyl 4-hydroxylase alpha subunit domain-containing protein n=1 Tax=Chytriomyces confervae TaxID=246404 RepID=A0A507FP38_9FUNG|nr:hypothetical protein HDU80_010683 [Chytriomyces hyalinus]TPX77096.1 hypothetical protein CcCBS67573_g01671 [Chytriomyces confervae]